jgi:hypothetical protein
MALTRSFALALALALVASTGCSGSIGNEETGDATVAVNVRHDALTGATAGIVWLNLVGVTDPAFNRWFPATPVNGTHTFSINALRVGDYSMMVYAYVDNAFDPTVAGPAPADWQTPAAVPITIARGNNTVGTIWLQQQAPAGTVDNLAATVNSIISSMFEVDSGVVGGVGAVPVTLGVTLSDGNGDAIQYAWAQTFSPALAGAGTFTPAASGVFPGTAPAANNVVTSFTYVAPTAYDGLVTLSLTITDGHPASPVSSVVAVPLRVGPFGRGNLNVPVQINGLPDILSFSATKGTLTADGLDSTVITLDAFDDAIDTLVATFTLAGTGCGTLGPVVSNQVGSDTIFQVVYTSSTVAGPCLVTASVTDNRPDALTAIPTVATLGLTQTTGIVQYAPQFVFFSPDNLVATVVNVDPLLGAPTIPFSVAAIAGATPLSNVVYTTNDPTNLVFTLPFDPVLGTVDGSYTTDACLGAPAGTIFNFTVTATATNPATAASAAIVWPITVNCL